MAEQIVSPGVFTRENDLSFIQPAPLEAGTAFVGPTVKGPVDRPTVVTSYNEYVRKFGDTFESGSSKEEFMTSMAVRSFFSQGGSTALVTRVVSGSFTPASNTNIVAADNVNITVQPFEIETLGSGVIYNNSTAAIDPGQQYSDSSLATGSIDNLRWEVNNVDNAKGTFSLLVRRGDDSINNKIILESFNNLSLDPNSANYIESVIGNQVTSVTTDGSSYFVTKTGDYENKSNYIRVTAVNAPTLNYLANDGATVNADSNLISYSGSLPQAKSGSFYGADGNIVKAGMELHSDLDGAASFPQGMIPASYTNAVGVLANKDDYQFNVLVTPGLIYENSTFTSTVQSFITLVENRGDAIYAPDLVGYGSTIANVSTNASALNSSYAASYWPWLKLRSATGKNEWAPASVVIPGVFASNDNASAPWFAPAGLVRGGIPGVLDVEKKLPRSSRDTLYSGKVNPIASFPGAGLAVFGQKTLQTKASALDRVNVRRLLIELKKEIADVARNLVFEQNTITTRNRFLARVNPYLESVVQQQGLYSYRVVMDDTNNTADVIDRNQLIGQIYIQPAKTAEFVVLDFSIEPTGATFGA